MYHRINKPQCAPQLEKLIHLARLTIAFGLQNEASIAQGFCGDVMPQRLLAEKLGDAFLNRHGGLPFLAAIRTHFIEHFEANGNRPAGEWLWGKPVAIAVPIAQLVVIPLAEKRGVLEAFDADIDLEARFAEGHLCYPAVPNPSADARDLSGTILRNFYQDILTARDGVPAEAIGETSNLDRQVVLQTYLRANRHLHVCPGCDGSPLSFADGIIHADCDHFFPQSRYPFLAVHPINLTPYCKDCNESYKRDKDALEAAGVNGLADIYHPYLCPARDDIEVMVERDAGDGQPRLRLRANSYEPHQAARLNSLNHLLNLESRWQGELALCRLQEKLIYGLLYATQDERGTGITPDDAWFYKKLEHIQDTMSRSIGKIEGMVPSLAYARWVARDAQARAEWLQDVSASLM